MMRLFAILVFAGLLLGMTPAGHEFYMTITELNKVQDTLQVSIRVFTDDLEHTLEDVTGKKVFLEPASNREQTFGMISSYVERHFKVSSAGKQYTLKWLGHEYVDDVTWIYAETVLDPGVNTLLIENTLLMHHYPGQQNMVHFRTESGFDSRLCTRDNPEARFVLTP